LIFAENAKKSKINPLYCTFPALIPVPGTVICFSISPSIHFLVVLGPNPDQDTPKLIKIKGPPMLANERKNKSNSCVGCPVIFDLIRIRPVKNPDLK
jgi:hypothetical protein